MYNVITRYITFHYTLTERTQTDIHTRCACERHHRHRAKRIHLSDLTAQPNNGPFSAQHPQIGYTSTRGTVHNARITRIINIIKQYQYRIDAHVLCVRAPPHVCVDMFPVGRVPLPPSPTPPPKAQNQRSQCSHQHINTLATATNPTRITPPPLQPPPQTHHHKLCARMRTCGANFAVFVDAALRSMLAIHCDALCATVDPHIRAGVFCVMVAAMVPNGQRVPYCWGTHAAAVAVQCLRSEECTFGDNWVGVLRVWTMEIGSCSRCHA